MKFSVNTSWGKGGGRAGVLQLGSCSIETPALLLTTRKGLPVFISPDLLSFLPAPDSYLLQSSPLHFLEGISMKTISELGGVHNLVGLKERIFFAVPRDSITSLPDYQSANKNGASFDTPSGRRLMRPVQYMEMISSMKPNMWTTLADEVPAWVSEKRNRASVDRTIRWLDDCIASNSASLTGGACFGSIVGGSNFEERKRCAQEISKRNVAGFCISGFGLGESMDERPALLNAITFRERCESMSAMNGPQSRTLGYLGDVWYGFRLNPKENLPEEKPRQICGLGLPEEVLQGVAAGIDLFDSTYIYHLTLGGFALTFSSEKIGDYGSVDQLSDNGSDGTKINLKAIIYRKDASPILESCNCYTCQNHTKAYLNHLLNVHEMLAHILLEIHNTHHYLGFFRSIREAIKDGKFDYFRKTFVENRRNNIFSAALNS